MCNYINLEKSQRHIQEITSVSSGSGHAVNTRGSRLSVFDTLIMGDGNLWGV